MNDTQNFAIWQPEYDGHAPPNWREGMGWDCNPFLKDGGVITDGLPLWSPQSTYRVPVEALTAPKETAGQKIECVEIIVGSKRKKEIVSLNELARLIKGGAAIYGITLAEPKDWAKELWADLMDVWDHPIGAQAVRAGDINNEHRAAIALLRERAVLKGEG